MKIALKFFDPVLALSSVIVMVKDLFGSARSVGNDKARISAQRTDFDFDDNFSVFGPASGSVSKAIKNSDGFASASILVLGPFKPAVGFSLKHRVGADTDRIKDLERFQCGINFWSGRAGIGSIADLAFREAPFKQGNQAFKLNADPL